MTNIENKFFEEYKRLDLLCRDLLKSDNGVSEYIAQMESVPYDSRCRIQTWDSDYKTLKHVRWVRNTIAHGDGSSECSEDDFEFVAGFYNRIKNQEDPFSRLRNESEKKHNSMKQNNFLNDVYKKLTPSYQPLTSAPRGNSRSGYQKKTRKDMPSKNNTGRKITVAVIVLILLIAAFMIFFHKIKGGI